MLLGAHVVGRLLCHRADLFGGRAQLHYRAGDLVDQHAQIGLHLVEPLSQLTQFVMGELLHVELAGEVACRHLAGLLQQGHHWIADLPDQQPGHNNDEQQG